MDWSTRKKLGCIAIVAAVFIVIVGYVVYKTVLSRPETCFDGIQNQNEQGIDCSGVCSRVCAFQAKTIVPLWSQVFQVTKGVHSVVAYVENQNVTAGVKKINYEFRVYDDQNILASEPIKGSTFIGPNDKTAIFESPVQTGNRIPKTVFFKFATVPDWITTDARYQVPQLKTSNTILTNETSAPKLSADIVNDTLFNYKNIPVVAIVYDTDGNAINASQTYLESIAQQSSETVYFTWPEKFERPVGRIEIIPRVNPFDQE
jgi:hypothetical protein